MITKSQLKAFLPRNKHTDEWTELLNELLPLYNINTPLRIRGFMSQCSHVSVGFTVLVENLNYSEKALRRTFKKYFTVEQAKSYARQPERIANRVYANRMGNGPESSGDGWRFRGHGVIQLTGHDNTAAFAKSINMPIDKTIKYLTTKKGALEGACWFWSTNGLNKLADAGDVEGMTRRINGGLNGLKDRQICYNESNVFFEDVQNLPGKNAKKMVIYTNKSSGENVVKIQQFLKNNGFNTVVDGEYGIKTITAVRVYQKFNGLQADGRVGDETWDHMFGKTQTIRTTPTKVEPVVVEKTVEPVVVEKTVEPTKPKPKPKKSIIHEKSQWRKMFGGDDS